MNISPLAPWHLWGGSKVLSAFIDPATVNTNAASDQLAKVSYKRPETWGFFFGAKIIDGPINTSALSFLFSVRFFINVGIGRSAFETSNLFSPGEFARMTFLLGPGFGINSLPPKWTTQTRSPVLIHGDANSFQLIDSFPAQDIQCSAQFQITTAAAPPAKFSYSVEVSAYFAPLNHVRADWYREDAIDVERFTGNETGGT